MKRTTLWLSAFLALAFTACGDNTSSKNSVSGANPDMGISDAANNNGGDSGDNNTGMNVGNNGDDVGNNNNGMPDGGDDDMTPPDDMGGADMSGADMGDDVGPNICGNGIVEGVEECDDGNNSSDDDCNPDCTFTCGDGVVGANEACDTAIPEGMDGACPTSCDDGDACTTGTLQGSACQAQCVFGDITACSDGDGCCPMMCNANNDDDCMAVCGNDVVEGTEICDGDCPADVTECDDGNACTTDGLTGSAATCDAMCTNDPITACVDDDGCCPAMCDSTMDNDCSATCGNDIVEPPETCDGNCPTSPADCDDGDVCTADTVSGSAANCTAMCENTPLGCDLTAADGCCPVGCDSTTDLDCTATCGNGTVEAGEQCDDGNTMDGDGCDANCQSEATAYRLSDLDLMDPHVYVDVLTCMDITNSVLFNLAPPINQMLEDAIQCDGDCNDTADDDGDLDLSFLLIFRPLDQGGTATGDLSIATADCSAPMSSTSCVVDSAVHTVEDTIYTNDATNDCLDVIPNTVRPYTPMIDASEPPCFASTSFDLTVDIEGIQIPLSDVQVGASYVGNPATSLTNGLLRGFITETTANSIIIPDSIDFVGGYPLSMLLPGGDPPDTNDPCAGDDACTAAGETCEGGQCQTVPNCAAHDDRDMHNGDSGWWFYFNFPADQVPFTEL